jgi:hypothetical protein
MPEQHHFDTLGETEPEKTVYTLTIRCPARPPRKRLPSFVTRPPVIHSKYYLKLDDTNKNFDCYERKHVDDMSTREVKVKEAAFPLEMRCDHVRQDTECGMGCYVLEKCGSIWRKECKRSDCEGHVYCGPVKVDEEGKSCFGKKGRRIVCMVP